MCNAIYNANGHRVGSWKNIVTLWSHGDRAEGGKGLIQDMTAFTVFLKMVLPSRNQLLCPLGFFICLSFLVLEIFPFLSMLHTFLKCGSLHRWKKKPSDFAPLSAQRLCSSLVNSTQVDCQVSLGKQNPPWLSTTNLCYLSKSNFLPLFPNISLL